MATLYILKFILFLFMNKHTTRRTTPLTMSTLTSQPAHRPSPHEPTPKPIQLGA